MAATFPWDLSPSLTEPRLVTLARIAVETRNRVFSEASREEGDTNWGLGCRAHERLGHALGRLAESGEHPWLTVNRDGLYLMPLIDGIAIRVFRGTPDKPSARHLDAVRAEYERRERPRQVTFSFMEGPVDDDGPWFWLLALDTDIEGKVLRAVYFQSNASGETRHAWEAPLDLLAPTAPVEMVAPAEPAEVLPPVLSLANDAARRGRVRRVRAVRGPIDEGAARTLDLIPALV